MDPNTTTQAKPSGIPRVSRLPQPSRSALPLPTSRLAHTTSKLPQLQSLRHSTSSSRLSTGPPAKAKLPLGTSTSATNVRPRAGPSSAQDVFKKPAPKQIPRQNVNGTRVTAASRPVSQQTHTEDQLGDLNGFRSASRASSRASSRAGQRGDHTVFEDVERPPSTPPTKKASRPSLSDRTIESLANVTPTPRSKRRSSFFQPDSPMTSRPSSALGKPRQPVASITPKLRLAKSVATLAPSGLPSPKTGLPALPKTLGLKPRASLNGLRAGGGLPSPSVQHTDGSKLIPRDIGASRSASKPAARARAPQKPPVSRLALRGGAPKPKIDSPVESSLPSADDKPAPNPAKSSAALREQIRRAKAERKSLTAKQDAPEATFEQSQPDFDETAFADPFNQQPQNLVMRKRIDAGRTGGKLNISALGLKEIPEEVLKMYDYEANQSSTVAWNEVVDLTTFIAADNQIETIPDAVFPDLDANQLGQADDTPNPQFGGLQRLDLHGNVLFDIPLGLRRLEMLSVLNLNRNRLMNDALDTIAQITSLRELYIADNILTGELTPAIGTLVNLELLELQGNKLLQLPDEMRQLTSLRVLNVSNNALTDLTISTLPTTVAQVYAGKNQLSGVLFDENAVALPRLQTLDVSLNQLTELCPANAVLEMLALHTLNASFNRLQSVPDLQYCPNLETLLLEDNAIASLPEGFLELKKIQNVDFKGNMLTKLDERIALMENLQSLNVAANPLRDRKFLTMSTSDIKESLLARLAPPSHVEN